MTIIVATANNTKCVLLICIAYTACDEIVQAVHESCKNKWEEIQPCNSHKSCSGRVEEVDGKSIDDGSGHSVQELFGVQTNELRATRASTFCNDVAEGVERTDKKSGVVGHAVHGSCGKWGEVQSLEASRTGDGVIPNVKSEKLLVDFFFSLTWMIGPACVYLDSSHGS
jgi:ditrans,polycis-polyprenyl diphosphate synthase